MSNITFFYPDKEKGWALGLNAAGGNIGTTNQVYRQACGFKPVAPADVGQHRLLPAGFQQYPLLSDIRPGKVWGCQGDKLLGD